MRALLVLMSAVLSLCFAQATEQAIWKEFVNWYRNQPATTPGPELMKGYAAKLASSGAAQAEIDNRLAVIRKIAATEPVELTAIRFNGIFSNPKPPFQTEPNAFLVRMVSGLKPGKALVPAMGQGRNAVYLARQGWDVTGYDISDRGIAMARAGAEKAGVRLNAVLKSHAEFDYGSAQWDLVVMTYHFAPLHDAAFVERVRESLRPGGMVIVEQFNAPPGPDAKGPANALLKSFADLRVIHYEDAPGIGEWGGFKARIGRIAAVKE
jgi:2-polyprenyl-3-methyl-5-hydroxy-6-metoxy-1,4-benzoquinol methylase